MRRSAVEAVGGYDPNYPHLEDYKFFYELSKQTALANLAEPLMEFNRDIDTNVSTRHRRTQFDTCLAIHREIWADYNVSLPSRYAAVVSGCCFARPDEGEAVHGPLTVQAIDAVGRAQHRLARAFTARHRPSSTTRAEMAATLRWQGFLLERHLVSRRVLPEPAARALRLSWDLPAAARRGFGRMTSRASR